MEKIKKKKRSRVNYKKKMDNKQIIKKKLHNVIEKTLRQSVPNSSFSLFPFPTVFYVSCKRDSFLRIYTFSSF